MGYGHFACVPIPEPRPFWSRDFFFCLVVFSTHEAEEDHEDLVSLEPSKKGLLSLFNMWQKI